MKLFLAFLIGFSSLSCNRQVETSGSSRASTGSLTYLALGDSYTKGEGIEVMDSFPYQLMAKLNSAGYQMGTPQVIARTGWTTSDLMRAMNASKMQDKYSFITVLIGVNNQYLKQPISTYRKEFTEILKAAVSRSLGGTATVYVISIPDWSVTPFGKESDTKIESASIDQFNAVNKEEARKAGVHYIDITEASRIAGNDESYISSDGLHPSRKMYMDWAEKLYVLVSKELN